MDREQINASDRLLGSTSASAEKGNAYFFASQELNQLLDLIRHLTVNSERIPLLLGQAGVGKSSILKQFQSQAPDNWTLCRIDANLMLQPEQLFSLLAKGFGVEVNDERVIERLIHRFEDLHQDGQLPVILIDDAHLLPVATIISLLRVHERHPDSHALIRVILFASPQIDELLNTPQIQAMNLQLLQRLELSPLNQEQTEQMIRQMLSTHGMTEARELSRGQLEKIYRDTAGLPGEIIRQLDRLLTREPSPPPSAHRARLPGLSVPTLVGALLVAITLLLVLWYQDEFNALFQGEGPAEESVSLPPLAQETLVPLKLPESNPTLKERDVFLTEGESETAASPGKESKFNLPEIKTNQVVPEDGLIEPTQVAVTLDQGPELGEPMAREVDSLPSITESTNAMEGDPGTATERDRWSLAVPLDSKFADPLVVRPSTEVSPTRVAEDDDDTVSEPQTMKQESRAQAAEETLPSQKAPEQRSASLVPVPSPAVKVEEPQSVSKTGVSEQAPKISAEKEGRVLVADSGLRREAWLLNQNPSAYTLQLVGVQEEEAVQRFLRSNQLTGPVAYFRSLRDGSAWFSVVYGIYPDRETAVAGRARLSASLRGAGVWPRSLASVQQAIQETLKTNP